MHIFPQLRKLERKYASELVVVGVHSAKFPTEKETDSLTSAVRRCELEHPVINDAEFQVWQQYSCRAWPTLMFIDPRGNVIGKHEGEMTFGQFDSLMQGMVAEFDELGIMQRSPLPTTPPSGPENALSFPGKVLADEAGGRLFIADTNHNRVLVSSFEGNVQQVIGTGEEALVDGTLAQAAFNHPQGMAIDGDILYVADTENHAIRRVDLQAGQVETIAGTGEQGYERDGRRPGRSYSLSSPWDLALHNGVLYIAMAGIHQLWSLELESVMVGPYAGSGREAITDGPLATAALAQPSGITTNGERLFFADSETSAIRNCDLDSGGSVRTLIGLGLFEFGDVDGDDFRVRMQHPIGITHHDGVLYVADTYNHKIKRVLPKTRSAFSVAGIGAAGHVDGPFAQARFSEPCGLSIANGKMYIADTNNHTIRVADMETSEVATLELTGL
jgi:DNA-binding beta-propeller fold protein YncE